jgi:hypothetical protein
VHSIFTDPDLKDGHPDLLDGGKIFVEILALEPLAKFSQPSDLCGGDSQL